MSSQNSHPLQLFAEDLDVTLAKLGLLACLLLFSLRLLAARALLVVIPFAGASAFGLYIVSRRSETHNFRALSLSGATAGYLPAVVLTGLALVVALVRLTGGRSLGIHLLVGLVGVAILVQILLVEHHPFSPGVILGQILLASVVVRLSAILATPGFVGVDSWTHVPMFVEGIVEAGSLSAISEFKYVMAPIYHLNGAAAALVFDSARLGMFLSIGILVAVSAVLVYTTGRLLLPARWALLATALYTFADQFVRWGIHVIPTSLALVFFLGALYSLTKLYYRDDPRLLGLLLVCAFAIVFTHQVSTAIILLLLGLATVTSAVVWLTRLQSVAGATARTTSGVAGVFFLTLAVTIFSWANTPFSGDNVFLWQMLDVFQSRLAEAGFLNLAGGGGAAGAANTSLLADVLPFIEWFGFTLLLSAAIVGAIVLLRRRDPSDMTFTYLASVGGMFVIVYGFSLFGIRTLMPGRWLAFLYAPMAIIAALGLYYLSENAPNRLVLAVFIILAVGYPMTMTVTEKATLDNPAFENQQPKFAYSGAEIAGAETITETGLAGVGGTIATDHPYRTLFTRSGEYEGTDLVIEDGEPTDAGPVVAREYQHQGATTVFEAGEPPGTRRSNAFLSGSVCPESRNHLYTSDVVTLCTTPGGETA